MVDITITTTAAKTEAQVKELNRRISSGRSRLMQVLSKALETDVKVRIVGQNKNTWAKSSKWLIAKGKPIPLAGAAAFVKSRVLGGVGQVYAETPPSKEKGVAWSLTQHHKGFENATPSRALVIIPLRVPSALGLASGRKSFGFIHRRAGKTPARQIWPTRAQAVEIMTPLASRWLAGLTKGL